MTSRGYLEPQESEAIKGLDQLSIDNLKCGRITKEALFHAMKRVMMAGYNVVPPNTIDQRFPSTSIYMVADELNFMLSAGKILCRREHGIEMGMV